MPTHKHTHIAARLKLEKSYFWEGFSYLKVLLTPSLFKVIYVLGSFKFFRQWEWTLIPTWGWTKGYDGQRETLYFSFNSGPSHKNESACLLLLRDAIIAGSPLDWGCGTLGDLSLTPVLTRVPHLAWVPGCFVLPCPAVPRWAKALGFQFSSLYK